MRTYLQHHASSKQNSDTFKEQCRNALEVFKSLSKDKKNSFVARWQQTKKSKNLDWVKEYEEHVELEKQTKKKYIEKRMNRTGPTVHSSFAPSPGGLAAVHFILLRCTPLHCCPYAASQD